jgi:hypothetical protein
MAHDTECSIDPETNQPQWYWVSRNSDFTTGQLSEYCDLWWVRPMRRRSDKGVIWHTLDVTPEGSHMYGWHGSCCLADTVKWCGTLPDSDLMLLVVGRS